MTSKKIAWTLFLAFATCSASARYIQPDPIGQRGGTNLFIYVQNQPLRWTDPSGLKTLQCTKPLDALRAKYGASTANAAYSWLPGAYHQYSCVVSKDGQVTCGGQDHAGSNWFRSPGKPSADTLAAGMCEAIEPDDDEFENCLKAEWMKPRPNYGIPFGTDCQEYDDAVVAMCRARVRRAKSK
jgi:hypothetical protein